LPSTLTATSLSSSTASIGASTCEPSLVAWPALLVLLSPWTGFTFGPLRLVA